MLAFIPTERDGRLSTLGSRGRCARRYAALWARNACLHPWQSPGDRLSERPRRAAATGLHFGAGNAPAPRALDFDGETWLHDGRDTSARWVWLAKLSRALACSMYARLRPRVSMPHCASSALTPACLCAVPPCRPARRGSLANTEALVVCRAASTGTEADAGHKGRQLHRPVAAHLAART